jgi:hypothetical protein
MGEEVVEEFNQLLFAFLINDEDVVRGTHDGGVL